MWVLGNSIWISFGLLFLFLITMSLNFSLFFRHKIRLMLFLLVLVFKLFVLLLHCQYFQLIHLEFGIYCFNFKIQKFLLMLHKFPIAIDLVLYYVWLRVIINRNKNYAKPFKNLSTLNQVFKMINLFLL